MSSMFVKIDNQRGLTLMELVVALSLTGLLLVVFIGANLFIHKTLTSWSHENTLVEERVFLLTELANSIVACDQLKFDSAAQVLTCYFLKDSTIFALDDDNLQRDNIVLNKSGITVDFFKVSQDVFTNYDASIILNVDTSKESINSLYSVYLSISHKGKTDVSVKKIRNYLAFSKR